MKNRIMRIMALCVVAVIFFSITVQAAATPTYTHWETVGERLTVPGRDMYKPLFTITGSDLGLEDPLEELTDVFAAEDGTVYILCGGNSKLYVLNSDYTFNRELIVVDVDGYEVDYSGAGGIAVEANGDIYICDTENARILVVGQDGILKQEITLPESDVIPDDFIFQPEDVVRDNDNNYYVLSQGSYYGAVIFSEQLEFKGFYGANTVRYTALDALNFLWDLLTNTNAKREKQSRVLPYAFTAIDADEKGYIYTATGALSFNSSSNGNGQIQMLSPGGTSILQKRQVSGTSVSASTYNFQENEVIVTHEKFRVQNFASVAINDDGYIYALDTSYGLVYIYDVDCNLLCAFGGGVSKAEELGMFTSATAMALNGDQIIIADSKLNRITVFGMTEYGALVQKAQNLYLKGDYAEGKELWKQVLQQDSNSRLAYRGLAKAYYTEGDYEKSMEYAEMSYDYVTYDSAYRQVRNAAIAKNFTLIFIIIIVAVAALVAFLIFIKKRETSLVKNVKVRTMLNATIHPFQSFTDVKYKGQGSMLFAVIIVALYTFTSTLKITGSSFLYRTTDVYNYNSLYTLAMTAGLVILFVVANWLVCTLMEGKGRLDEIAIVTAYCLIPQVLFNVISTILSYGLSYEDKALLDILSTVLLIYTAFLLIVAIMTVHEYTFGKLLWSTLITLFFMILIVFIIFMMVILIQQFGNFIYSLYMEVAYR